MTVFKQGSTCLAKTVVMPVDRGKMSSGEDGLPPLTIGMLLPPFVAQRAHLRKKVTAHVLRHTVATTLLFNGCPIGHIKELLGHARLDTTCRYYLGVDVRAAKEPHGKFLRYE